MESTHTTGSGSKLFSIFYHLQYENFVAGVAGGTISTLMLHPMDLIKLRFAVNDGITRSIPQYNGTVDAVKKICKTEGLTGLYRGITPNALGAGSAWGIYFLLYNCVKTWVQDGNTTKPVSTATHLMAATNAGVLTLLMTNPIWVVKTRLCLQYEGDAKLPESKRYTGMIDAFKKISLNEGFYGFYRGLTPGLFGVSHGALQFVTYEEMKVKYNEFYNRPINTKLSTIDYIVFSCISKLIAATATYPYQVIRARLQDQHHNHTSTLSCIKYIWKYEGWRGYYKGLSVNLMKVTPATVITFVVYEHVSHYLLGNKVIN